MITNTGKKILAKYLIGQAPAYASYIAVGCGANPYPSNHTFTTEEKDAIHQKQSLDFEMFRVPISSRGFVHEDGLDKVVLTAELPTEERYEITEVGVYSAGSNPAAGAYDSRTLFSFSQSENWSLASLELPLIIQPLDTNGDDKIDDELFIFRTNADNRTFSSDSRLNRNERCRFLNDVISISGNSSKINESGGRLSVASSWTEAGQTKTPSYVQLSGISVDFNKQSPIDQLRFAFSVINRDGTDTNIPSAIKIVGEFLSADGLQSARFEEVITNVEDDPIYDFTTNRYFVVSKELQALHKTAGFSWGAVASFRVYASIEDSSNNPTADYLLCLDAIRIENVFSQNPLYGLTGYSVIKSDGARPIIKSSNTTNYIEFRFAIGVQ